MAAQILEALEYLHSHHVTHGNLSPSNIMWFSSDFCWKLVELDYASPIEDKAMVPPFLSRYAAPELIMAFHNRRHQVRLRPAADMWSVGVIAFEVFTGMLLTCIGVPFTEFVAQIRACANRGGYEMSSRRDSMRSIADMEKGNGGYRPIREAERPAATKNSSSCVFCSVSFASRRSTDERPAMP